MLSVFCSPSRYTQGKGATAELGREMTALGLAGPVLFVAGKTAVRQLSTIWKRSLDEAGMSFTVHSFSGECALEEIERVKRRAEDCKAKTIIGAGGGKVLDTARAAAADLGLPVVSCPTIASSDAPCSALSVIYTEDGEFQQYRFYRRNPDLVLVDTQVIAEAPARLLSAGMGDALATWFEAKTCVAGAVRNMRGGASTASALALSELCYRTLLADGSAALAAVSSKVVTPALERLIEANTLLSGLGFESSGLAAAHAVHSFLTAAPETHSYFTGEKVAFGLSGPARPRGNQPPKYRGSTRIFDGSCPSHHSGRYRAIRVTSRTAPESVATRTTAPGETIHNEPFDVTTDMVADAILAADALGRAWRRR